MSIDQTPTPSKLKVFISQENQEISVRVVHADGSQIRVSRFAHKGPLPLDAKELIATSVSSFDKTQVQARLTPK